MVGNLSGRTGIITGFNANDPLISDGSGSAATLLNNLATKGGIPHIS
jgi:hypothetical protein